MRPARLVKELRLERFSAEFAKALLARHPEWEPYLGYYEEQEDGLVARYLEVRVPSEHPIVTDPLLIRTCPGQVYLDWAGWHDHVFPWPDQDEESWIEDALAKIELWVSDDYLFATAYRGGVNASEWGCRAGAENELRLVFPPKPGDRVVVRSWRGTHDREWTA